MAEELRKLKIKVGSCKRLMKEVESYKKECAQQQARIDKLVSEGADEATIKKQKEVLQESQDMIPDCTSRLKVAFSDLESQMEQLKSSEHFEALSQKDEWAAAVEVQSSMQS
mmetsp:Transcript_48312/g.121638  ORF Transcript_48312/g.121638 Transcript_48312/m.121638 type:complete len:112 (-) Transcript_48312:54-389(-)|eukprot:CAMPEP_0177634694 /NCGR_PEP_ID=MMETSP0447-20121125/3502_1 /TAXON_ID=0 /ORGANISM="Stygamoeba regulata, Strain BSH-02190019" /LENGTH=111 /DNA_ID=CAMNT_0019136427 /DNA_START=62 /DNA_END=397 /DNA_ORIENTATION=-